MLSNFGQQVYLNGWTIGEAAYYAGLTDTPPYDPSKDLYTAAGRDTEYARDDNPFGFGSPTYDDTDDDDDVEDWWGEDREARSARFDGERSERDGEH